MLKKVEMMPDAFDMPIVNNVNDIMSLISSLAVGGDNMQLNTKLLSVVDSKDVVYDINANIKHRSKKEILKEGFNIIKARLDIKPNDSYVSVNGKKCKPHQLRGNDSLPWLDQVVSRWLGGTRNGLDVVWTIGDKTYKYNPLVDELYED